MSTEQITISYFKAHCLDLINNMQTSHNTIIITKRDKPVATVMPIGSQVSILGLLKDKAKIKSDIIKPIKENWDAVK